MSRVNAAFPRKCGTFNPEPAKLWFLASVIACCLLATGCTTLSQSTGNATPPISARASLPTATVGTHYSEVVSVWGAASPYSFSLAQGMLPPGLLLASQTGSISGTPTQAGTFSFTVMIFGSSFGPSGNHSYQLTVNSCSACIKVEISPSNPSIIAGGKIQFSASVSNTSNTAVTWSATAGTISSSGLYTAPSGAISKPITVTASSSAAAGAQASTSVSMAAVNSPLSIATSSVPSTVESVPYSSSLSASGGQPPYTWSIVSGSLPSGLSLAANGLLSGAATRTGTFSFTVLDTDATAHTAQKALSMLVSSPSANCGPPAYPCSRSDLNVVQFPSTPPNVGNLLGANTIVTDPDFNSRIVRVTDAHTNPSPDFINRTYVTSSSGSADDNGWNIDSTLFILEDTGTNAYPFSFNPNTLQASRLYVSSFPATNGLQLTNGGVWSRINANVLYSDGGTSINKYDFSDRSNPPAPQLVYDFTKSQNCLPSGFTVTWSTKGGVSGDDTVFGMAYSNTGSQGTGNYAVVYKVGSGCSLLNTATGQVSGDWGARGPINIHDRWTIHNVKLSKDGNYLVIAATNCTSSTCSTGPYYWQVGTTTVSSCGMGGQCGGHWTEGYSHWINNDNSPMGNQVIRSFADPIASVHNVSNSVPSAIVAPLDQHQSWNNVDPGDTLPFFSTTWSTITPFPAPWYNEIIAVSPDGSGKTWRFAHNFITARSQTFSTQYAIGNVSQDGRFFILSSDWMGKLGSNSGSASCTIGTDCRGDVFVVELK